MQLRIALLLAAALLPSAARAQEHDDPPGAEGSIRVYTDDDRVTVVTPSAGARLAPTRRLSLQVDATVDMVSAASVDITSQASPRGFQETRVEGGAEATWAATRLTAVKASAVASGESDYRSLHLGLGLRTEVARRNGIIDVQYTAAVDRVGRKGDAASEKPRQEHRLTASFTQVLDRTSYLDVVLDGELVSGYQANPYRFVPIFDTTGELLYNLPEEVPDRRAGLAAVARLRHAAGPLFVHADYRLYRDDWGVTSHTGKLRVLVRPSASLLLGLDLRGYAQSAATFHRERYTAAEGEAPAWRSGDRALGAMGSVSAGVTCDLAPWDAGGLHLVASVAAARFVWLDYALQEGRDALVLTLGANTSF